MPLSMRDKAKIFDLLIEEVRKRLSNELPNRLPNIDEISYQGDGSYDRFQDIIEKATHDSTKLRVTAGHYILETISTLD